jgi:hypothetical protein
MAAFKEYLYPTTRTGASPDTTHSAEDTGTWTGSTDPGLIDEKHDAPDDGDYIVTGLGPGPGYQTRYWWAAYQLTAPLPGVAISKVRLRLRFGSVSLNSTTVDVLLNGFLIIGATRYLHGTPVTVFGTPGFVGFDPQEFSWEWTINPATSLAFTVDDLQTIQVGLRFVDLTDPTGANTPEARTTQLFLEYEATSSAGNVEQIRHVLSAELNQDRLPIRTLELELPIQYGDVDILEPIWLSHRALPTPDGLGTAEEEGYRAPLLVLRKSPRMELRQMRLTCLDLTGLACTYWSPMTTGIGQGVEDIGIARIDRGGGWTVARNQTGYVRRPPDNLWTDRLIDTPRYFSEHGLAVCGGGQIWHANNCFAVGTGNAFTGWTVVTNGAGTVVQDLVDILFDFLGVRRSVKITNGGTSSDFGYLGRLVPFEANRHGRALMKYKTNGSGANRPRMIVRRFIPTEAGATQTDDWLPGTGWTATLGQWFLPDNLGVSGAGPDTPNERAEFWSEDIPVGSAACEIRAYAGFSIGLNVVSNIYAAAIVKTATGIDVSYPRDFLLTTSAELTQEPDAVAINNDPDFAVAIPDQGTVHFHFIPFWSDSELPVGTRKTLWQLACDDNGANGTPMQWMALHYVKFSSTVSRLILEQRIHAVSILDAILELSGNQRAAYLTPMKIALRWVSAIGELRLPARSLQVFCNGAKAESAAGLTLLPVSIGSRVYLRALSLDATTFDVPQAYPDGCYRYFRMLAGPMPDERILRALG